MDKTAEAPSHCVLDSGALRGRSSAIQFALRELGSAGFALASFGRLLSRGRVSALWAETSNFGPSGGLPAVRRSGGLSHEVVKPVSVRPVAPSRYGPG